MDLMDLVAERVKIVREGEWLKSQVKLKVDVKYNPKITEEMKEIAKKRFAERKMKNPKLFDGPAFHLDLSHSIIQPDYIFLSLGKTTYSFYDIARKEYIEKYGWQGLPMGTGVNAAVLTSDSKIVMHYRFPHVDFAAKIGTIGGTYQSGHPFDDIKREIKEELAITKKEMVKIFLVGIDNRLDERMNYELVFLIRVALNKSQVRERKKLIEEKEGRIFFLDCLEKRVYSFLAKNHQNITSSSFACLVMLGHYLWGPNWSKK